MIADKRRTPFNIGHAIELNGFTLAEAQPLAEGLQDQVAQPEQILAKIWHWTRGQPFLTQKLLSLVVESPEINPDINQLVRSKIIDNWETQDEPKHLKTIRDRILSNQCLEARLLGIYQKVLQHKGIPADDSDEQLELRLSGLVVKRQGKLQVANPIYAQVFNGHW